MFRKAIVRLPSPSLVQGITSNPGLGKPDYALALRQHAAYVAALESCGLSVLVLPAEGSFPDSCFVEDIAVCTGRFALVARPGAPSRRGETEGIEAVLRTWYEDIEAIGDPGTLEGGDVMMVGDTFYVGLSSRTNREGAAQFIAALSRRDYEGVAIEMPKTLHLKTGLSYLEDGILLVAREFVDHPEFAEFTRIEVDPAEGYAANSIRVNDKVLVPAGNPKTARAIREAGLEVLEVDTSEYRKLDGGLSCLSLRF